MGPETFRAALLDAPDMTQRIERLCLVAGPNGSGILSEYLREEVATLWLGRLGITRDDLTEIEVMALTFTTAGLVAMASTLGQDNPAELLLHYVESGFFQNASGAMISLLKEAAARKLQAESQ